MEQRRREGGLSHGLGRKKKWVTLMKSWGEDEEIFFSLIMSHQENNACLQGRNVSSPDGEETIPGKRETTSRRGVIF